MIRPLLKDDAFLADVTAARAEITAEWLRVWWLGQSGFLVCYRGESLLLDPYSKTLALSVFIPLYYAMYWVAWRVALFIGDDTPVEATEAVKGGGGGAKAASWLLAPAVLALDLCD